MAVTPKGFKIVCKAFSIAFVQGGMLGVVEVLLAAVPVLLVPVVVLLLGALLALLLLGALLLGTLEVVVVPEVVPLPLVAVVELPVLEVVLLALAAHPEYVADAPNSCKIPDTKFSMGEQELVPVPVELVPLEVVLPEEPVLLHFV